MSIFISDEPHDLEKIPSISGHRFLLSKVRNLFFKPCCLAPENGTGGEERKGTVCEALTETLYVYHLSLSNVGQLGLLETQLVALKFLKTTV